MDPFVYIAYFGWLSGNQALVHHLEDSNTKVKNGLVCFFFFYLWQITVMSDKKFALSDKLQTLPDILSVW